MLSTASQANSNGAMLALKTNGSPVQVHKVSNMIEHATFDLALADAAGVNGKVVNFSSSDDRRWAGVVVLGADETYALDNDSRHDLLVLGGSIGGDGMATMHRGAFASRCDSGLIQAGDQGATVFVYRERAAHDCRETVQAPADRAWHKARAAGMRVAPLSDVGHALTLVEWEPGTRTREHAHPNGEEIFVLSGELRSQDERYPAGTWLRLHPGSRHEPFADIPTVIVLRNGHLDAVEAVG